MVQFWHDQWCGDVSLKVADSDLFHTGADTNVTDSGRLSGLFI